ncbi:hypothetical protein TIFTF001_034478 [Ficus carica]|uniref:Bulb-type lectin domain-containing protein n=1 Tax=Ficus carica TaxID=3494 RepID=A0AA88E2X3_FICCA|nr:hypothetical protein TIFTF001_034478 [Ficus carica]
MAVFTFKLRIFVYFLSSILFPLQLIPLVLFNLSSDNGTTLISKDGVFEFGFFTPGNSKNRYNKSVVWPTSESKQAQKPVVVLLDSGNLVLRDEEDTNSENYLWQSFDYPSDTMLPGMKVAWDFRTASYITRSRYIRMGTTNFYHTESWFGLRFSGSPELRPNPLFNYSFVYKNDEVNYTYDLKNKSVISRMVMNQTTSTRQRLTWIESDQSWKGFVGAIVLKPIHTPSPPLLVIIFHLVFVLLTPSGCPPTSYVSCTDAAGCWDLTWDHPYAHGTIAMSSLSYILVPRPQDTCHGHANANANARTHRMSRGHMSCYYKLKESGLTAFSSVPRDYCDKCGVCGANANCTITDNPICQCLIGFKPKSQEKWNLKDWSGGGVWNSTPSCKHKDKAGF